jgi:DNA-binding transcriptional ArsR family regulator
VPNYSPSLDLMYSALADASRRTMVERLSRGPASVKELAAPLAMSLPAVMQHLRVLEASGLVRSEKAGRVRTCRIEPAALQAAEQWIADRRAGWVSRLDRLGEYLADTPSSDPSTLPDATSGSSPGASSDPSSDPQEDR